MTMTYTQYVIYYTIMTAYFNWIGLWYTTDIKGHWYINHRRIRAAREFHLRFFRYYLFYPAFLSEARKKGPDLSTETL